MKKSDIILELSANQKLIEDTKFQNGCDWVITESDVKNWEIKKFKDIRATIELVFGEMKCLKFLEHRFRHTILKHERIFLYVLI